MASLNEQEQQLWDRLRDERSQFGVPRAVCASITPVPFWGVITAIVVFIPFALVLSFVMKRQALLVQADELVIQELGFWRMRPLGEPLTIPLAQAEVSHEKSTLVIDGKSYHLQPGWGESADRIAALAG